MLPKFATKRFKAGETVFRKGDAGDLFYVIQSGQVEIIDETNGTEKKIRELGANDYFGEIALLKNVPRTMAARVVGDSKMLVLGKEDTLRLIEGSVLFASSIDYIGSARLEAFSG